MSRVELEILAISDSVTSSNNYALVLGEIGGNRRLPVVIGGCEARAIALALEHIEPKRPFTHDLLRSVFDALNIQLREVVINKLHEGVFYSILVCEQNGTALEIDSRTSDAVALAVRFRCPIWTYDTILNDAGVVIDTADEPIRGRSRRDSSESWEYDSPEVLQAKLQEALSREDYESAAKIRDEIKRREGKGS